MALTGSACVSGDSANGYELDLYTWDGSEAGLIANGAGLAVAADGGGYWPITASGTVYAYGDATGGTSITSNYSLTGAVGSPAR